MKNHFLIMILFLFFSCEKIENEYYESGKIKKTFVKEASGKINGLYKEYYENGKIKIKSIYNKGILHSSERIFEDSTKFVMSNIKNNKTFCKVYRMNKLFQKGWILNGKKTGTWLIYNKDGKLFKKQEYILLCKKQYLNQFWAFDDKGDLIEEKSNYIHIKSNKLHYKIGDSIKLKICYKPILGDDSKNLLFFSPRINKNFCGIKENDLDVNYSENRNFDLVLIFEKSGKKNVSGFIQEFLYKPKENDHLMREIYFNFSLDISK